MSVSDHFAVISIGYVVSGTGLKVIVITDVPCHLYMRWTLQEPLVHLDPYIRRGIAVGTTPRFCFTVYEDNEQLEPGDTYIHTFDKPDWPVCQTRWFYFWGTVSGIISPSESHIEEFHRKEAVDWYTFYSLPQDNYVYFNNTIYNTVRVATDGYIGVITTSIIAGQAREAGHQYIYRGGLYFDTSTLPPFSLIDQAELHLYGNPNSALHDEQDLVVVPGDALADTGMVPADYGQLLFYTKEFGKFSVTAGGMEWDIDGYNVIPLNTDGVAQINPYGITKYALRGSHDINNIPDTGFIERNRFGMNSYELGEGLMPLLKIKLTL